MRYFILIAYYLAIVVGAFDGTAKICSKSHISKIVDRNEMGKIMSFLSTFDTLIPLLFTTTSAYIFTNTMDSYPGTIYLVISAIIIMPICVLTWIKLCTKRPDNNDTNNKHGNIEMKEIGLEFTNHITHEKYPGDHINPDIALGDFYQNQVFDDHESPQLYVCKL